MVAVEERPRLDVTIDLIDALDAVADEFGRIHPPVTNAGRGFGEAKGARLILRRLPKFAALVRHSLDQ